MYLWYLSTGVAAGRKVLYLKELGAVLICDPFYPVAESAHFYEKNFHVGSGACRLEGNTVFWQGRCASALLTSLDDGEYALVKAPYSRDYNALLKGNAMVVRTEGRGFASLISVLSMDGNGRRHTLSADHIPVKRRFPEICWSPPG